MGVQRSCETQNRKTTVPISSMEVLLWPDVLAFFLFEVTAAPGIALGCSSTKLSAADASEVELSDKETKLHSHWTILPISTVTLTTDIFFKNSNYKFTLEPFRK